MMETALFNTNKILGINSQEHSLDFQKTTTCGPLKLDVLKESARRQRGTQPKNHATPPFGMARKGGKPRFLHKQAQLQPLDQNTTMLALVT